MNLRQVPALPEEMRAELSKYYRDDTLTLQDLLQQDLSVWLEEWS